MDVPLIRQAVLFQIMEDFLEKWTTFDLLAKRLSQSERELMFEWLDRLRRKLNLPNILNRQENDQMAHVGTIVQKKPDQTVAEDFVDLAAGTNDGYIGYAFAENGSLVYGQLPGGETDSLQTIKDTMEDEDKKKLPMSFIFGKGADTEEGQQPFNTLQNANGDCILATFVEGDLQGFEALESSHTIEYNAHQQYLAPKIMDIFTSCSEDLSKVVEKLNSGFVKREILVNCFPVTTARGEILLVFANGQTVNITKGDKHQKYVWGEVSQALGYQGVVEKPVEVKPPEKKLLGGNKPVAQPVKPKLEEVKKETTLSAAMDGAKKDLGYMILPPAAVCTSFKSLQAFYRNLGHPDHQPTDEDINAAVGKAHLAPTIQIKPVISNAAFNTLLKQGKFLLPPPGTSKNNAPVIAKQEAKIIPAIITAADRETFNKVFKPKMVEALKNYDDGSRLIIPPDKAAEFLKDKPMASEQLGINLDEFLSWSEVAYENLCTKLPMVAGTLLQQYALEIYNLRMAVASAAKIKKAM